MEPANSRVLSCVPLACISLSGCVGSAATWSRRCSITSGSKTPSYRVNQLGNFTYSAKKMNDWLRTNCVLHGSEDPFRDAASVAARSQRCEMWWLLRVDERKAAARMSHDETGLHEAPWRRSVARLRFQSAAGSSLLRLSQAGGNRVPSCNLLGADQ